eukprot:gene10916-3621_t
MNQQEQFNPETYPTIYYIESGEEIVNNTIPIPSQNLTPKFSRKVFYPKNEIRLIEMNTIFDFFQFKNYITSFLNENTYNKSNSKLFYRDNENDWILLENNNDLQKFLLQNQQLPLKIECPSNSLDEMFKTDNFWWSFFQRIFIALFYILLFIGEKYVSSRWYKDFRDVGFQLFTPIYQIIKVEDMYWLRFVLFGIQTIIIMFIIAFIFIRVFLFGRLGLGYQVALMYTIRMASMMLFVLPNHPEVIWHFPGIPDTLNDYFFSGHVALSIICANEISKIGFPMISRWIGIYFNIFQTFVFMITRSHYSADVICGIFCGCTLVLWFDKSGEKDQ